MSGETRAQVSGWTVDTLLVHVQQQLADRGALHAQQVKALEASAIAAATYFTALLDAAKEATKIAEANATLWRAAANEWRTAMDNKDRLLITRLESDKQFTSLDSRLKMIEEHGVSMQAERRGSGVVWGYIVGASGGIAAIISLLFTYLRHQ